MSSRSATAEHAGARELAALPDDWPEFHRQLLDAVQEAVIATDIQGRVLYWNRFAETLYGWRADEALGRNILDLNVSAGASADAAEVMKTLQAGGTWSGEIALRHRDGRIFPAHVSDGPLRDPTGKLIGIVGISYDITPRKEAERKQSLLIRELHHRVKNTLSTVQAIMGTTARNTSSVEEFQKSFSGRLSALARTHALLTEDPEQSAPISGLLLSELEPFDDRSGRRIVLDGPKLVLPSQTAVPLGMAVHELTTNAAKYGALSDPKGSVAVRWREVDEGGRKLLLEWQERGGPPVQAPTREGFGTRLLKRLLSEQSGSDVRVDFPPEGVQVSVSLPLSAE